MKEYKENAYFKIISVSISLSFCFLSLWLIWNQESALVVAGGLAMLGFFLYGVINPFIYRIILTDDSIEEINLFRKKRIFFKDVTHINIQSFFSQIKAARKEINVGRVSVQNFEEIIGTVVSKIKDNKGLLFAGDPILFQSYINDYSENKLLREFGENNLTNFTFVEDAELHESRWLFRSVNLKTSKGDFNITYFGRGKGYECVFVNDELVSKKDSNLWYVPEFNFNYKGINFSVNIRVYPWLTIRKFWIEIDNQTVYSE